MNKVMFRIGVFAEYQSLVTKDPSTFYFLSDTNQLFLGEVEITSSSSLAAVIADVAQNAADISNIKDTLTKLEGEESVTGSIKNIIKSYIDNMEAAITKNVYIEDVSAGQSDYGKVYKFYQGADGSDMTNNRLVGTINIPKDMGILEASNIVNITYSDGKLYDGVTDVTALIKDSIPAIASDAGKYLKIKMQDIDNALYTNLSEFFNAITTNNQTDEIILTIDANNNITGVVGEIAASKILFDVDGENTTTIQDEIENLKAGFVWQSIE